MITESDAEPEAVTRPERRFRAAEIGAPAVLVLALDRPVLGAVVAWNL
jgi:hypothetical protein